MSCEATVTAVKLKETLPPASNVVSRLCSSWKICFLTALCIRARIMEKPPKPTIINRADSQRSKTGSTLKNTCINQWPIGLHRPLVVNLYFIRWDCIFYLIVWLVFYESVRTHHCMICRVNKGTWISNRIYPDPTYIYDIVIFSHLSLAFSFKYNWKIHIGEKSHIWGFGYFLLEKSRFLWNH